MNAKLLRIHIEADGEPWPRVHVYRFAGIERVSEMPSFLVDVACDADTGLPAEAIPGAIVNVVFSLDGHELRRFHGVLGPVTNRLEASGAHETYRLELRPRASLLGLVELQEVYLEQSVPEIIATKLERVGFGAQDFEQRLVGTYAKREIVVQHGESDLAFVSRLAEHAGITIFFEHGRRDKLVITDHAAGFRVGDSDAEVPFRARGEESGVYALESTTHAVPADYVVQDYNYRTPQLDLSGRWETADGTFGGVVEYGAHVKTPADAAALARVRGEERVARRLVYKGESACPELAAGRRVTLLDYPRLAAREELLVLGVEHDCVLPLPWQTGVEPRYRNRFEAIPGSVVHRPVRRTPKPRMPGVVTGVVQPGAGGEVGGPARLDAQGRYTVQLHFDSAAYGEQRSSHPMRMAQPFVGHGNAMHLPLLPGSEVLVAFVNGDPDRPVIVGALPNALSPAAVTAVDATQNRIRSAHGVEIVFGNTVRTWR